MLSRYRLIQIAAFAILFVPAPWTFADDPENAQSFESRFVAVVDSVLENHIDPPTRQEMLLFGVKSVYQAAGESLPNGLSKRISELSTNEQIAAYLTSIRSEFEQLSEFEGLLISGIFKAVPGGGVLIGAEDARVQGQLAANRYVGIGIALRMKNELPGIMKVFYDGPGWKAGVKADDVILQIDGESTADKDLGQIVKELRGEEGSELTLLLRQAEEEPRELKVIRGVTFIPTIEGSRQISDGQWHYTVDSAPDVALLRIRQIGPSTVHELKKIEARLRREQIVGIVLDLREGGGILHDVVMLADQFLEQGTIGYVRSLDSVTKHEARPGSLYKEIPLAVLIANYSNADRVYLTAALQDQGRAIVVGEPTQGETYVRSHVEIPGGDKMLLATGLLQRGDGTTLLRPRNERWLPLPRVHVDERAAMPAETVRTPSFIMPDYVVRFPLPNEECKAVKDGLDPMLSKAIEVLRNTETPVRSDKKNESVTG